MKNFNFKTLAEINNEIDLLKDGIENLEKVVGESYTSQNAEYWDETFSPYYDQLEEARSEMIDLRALKAEFIKQHKSEKPQVDFDLLKGMLRKGGVGTVLGNTYCNLTQDELRNLATFLEAMKNPKFATKASHILKDKKILKSSEEHYGYEIQSTIDGEGIAIFDTVQDVIGFYKTNGTEYEVSKVGETKFVPISDFCE